MAVMAEWAVIVAALVYAFEQGGARATGLASLAVLSPALFGAPIAAALNDRFRPEVVRRFGLAVMTGGYALAAATAAAELAVAIPVFGTMVGLISLSTLRPTGAVLLPAAVRTTRELTTSNLWT